MRSPLSGYSGPCTLSFTGLILILKKEMAFPLSLIHSAPHLKISSFMTFVERERERENDTCGSQDKVGSIFESTGNRGNSTVFSLKLCSYYILTAQVIIM